MKHYATQFDLVPADQVPFNLAGEIQATAQPKPTDDTPALFAVPPSFKPKTHVHANVNTGLFVNTP